MYSILCEFLLLKPSIDLSDVPEFYKLFYSSRLEVKLYSSVHTLTFVVFNNSHFERYFVSQYSYLEVSC